MKTKLSWFQKVVLIFFTISSFIQEFIQLGDVFYALGYAIGFVAFIFLLMWLFNKFVIPKIKVTNKTILTGWQVIRIVVTVLIIIWVIILVVGLSGWFVNKIDTYIYLEPEKELSKEEMSDMVTTMNTRIKIYWLRDISIEEINDENGNSLIKVGLVNPDIEELKELLSKGKFEAKISNVTVFEGGEDITYVCMHSDCAGIDPTYGCGQSGDQWFCRFRFSISLSHEAAQRQADITRDLEVVVDTVNGVLQQYLSQKLMLFLDDKQVDELRIGAELKGKAETNIQISGSGIGVTQQEAEVNALQSMDKLRTYLISGDLPSKLRIVRIEKIGEK